MVALKAFLRRLLTGGVGVPPWDFPGRGGGEHYLVVVRAGEPVDPAQGGADAALSPPGRAQAESLADALAPLGPLDLVVAPLRRAQETAAPLARRWGTPARVERGLAEPAPDELDDPQWRRRLLDTVATLGGDAVVVVDVGVLRALVGGEGIPRPGSHTTLRLPAS